MLKVFGTKSENFYFYIAINISFRKLLLSLPHNYNCFFYSENNKYKLAKT